MEFIMVSICIFAMTGIAIYEHDKIIRYIKVVEKKQLIVEKLRKNLLKIK